MAQELRDAGIWVELDYEGKSLKSQMRKADRMKSSCVIILGEEELKKTVCYSPGHGHQKPGGSSFGGNRKVIVKKQW